MASVATSVKLDPTTRERIDRLAAARDRSAHWIMKRAIEEYVDREEKLAQFAKDADEALEDYRRTGLHLTNEEVMEWLKKVAAGDDAPMPEPHT